MKKLVNKVDAGYLAGQDWRNIKLGALNKEYMTTLDVYITESLSPLKVMGFAEYRRYIKSLNL